MAEKSQPLAQGHAESKRQGWDFHPDSESQKQLKLQSEVWALEPDNLGLTSSSVT